MSLKRRRSKNWSDEDVEIFCRIFEKYRHIIEHNSLTSTSNKRKAKTWKHMTKLFNRMSLSGIVRNTEQLKDKLKNIRTQKRREGRQQSDYGDVKPIDEQIDDEELLMNEEEEDLLMRDEESSDPLDDANDTDQPTAHRTRMNAYANSSDKKPKQNGAVSTLGNSLATTQFRYFHIFRMPSHRWIWPQWCTSNRNDMPMQQMMWIITVAAMMIASCVMQNDLMTKTNGNRCAPTSRKRTAENDDLEALQCTLVRRNIALLDLQIKLAQKQVDAFDAKPQ